MNSLQSVSPIVAGLVLDLGEVLIQLDFVSLLKKLQGQSPEHREAIEEVNRWELYDAFERGKISERDFYHAITKRFNLALSFNEFEVLWNSVLKDSIPDAASIVERLSRQTPLFALTNSNETHMRHVFTNYPWIGLFHRVFTSFEMGCRKPEVEIYAQVAKQVVMPPGALLFIDDRLDNVEGAKAAGLLGEHCANPKQDLVPILKKYGFLQN